MLLHLWPIITFVAPIRPAKAAGNTAHYALICESALNINSMCNCFLLIFVQTLYNVFPFLFQDIRSFHGLFVVFHI